MYIQSHKLAFKNAAPREENSSKTVHLSLIASINTTNYISQSAEREKGRDKNSLFID